MKHIVIVGGSIAGITAADALRAGGHDGAITVLSSEQHEPYLRPSLSKSVLGGRESAEDIGMPMTGLDAELVLGTTATGLDPQRRIVHLDGGTAVPYDGLVVATGARTTPYTCAKPCFRRAR
jgi:NADPH-dependent 2,4-dienoyl-CoA reductase/sulfur reductase-like enzyme